MMESENIIRAVMPVGVEMTSSDISNATKKIKFLTLHHVSAILRNMDDIVLSRKITKTIKIEVEQCDEKGKLLKDEDGNTIKEYIKRRKAFIYWIREEEK